MSSRASPKLASQSRAAKQRSSPQTRVAQVAELREVALPLIDLPRRPARRFLGDIASLADSMQEYGLQQPITVRQVGDRFQLTSGLRRLSAAQMLGWKAIAAFVRNVSADQAYLVDLVENLQREDLSPEEEADALGELIRARGWTLEQVAAGIKRSVGYVSKRVRVFEDPALRDAITQRGLAVSTAEELLAFEPKQRARAVELALAERWDQTIAREAAGPKARVAPSDSAETADASANGVHRTQHSPAVVADLGGHRSRGFTRAIREFHQMILAVRLEDLSPADRSALRALYRDLVMLARATSNQKQPVFPPLPSVAGPKSTREALGRLSRRQRP
jgi:ParB family chromosome partitioning protein